jgi:hypothetical protein
VYGEWPTDLIDHANGDPSDNRLCNLREANRATNAANARRPRDNTSGFKGVSWAKSARKWRATLAGKHIGIYDTKEDAASAYARAAKELHGEFARSA